LHQRAIRPTNKVQRCFETFRHRARMAVKFQIPDLDMGEVLAKPLNYHRIRLEVAPAYTIRDAVKGYLMSDFNCGQSLEHIIR